MRVQNGCDVPRAKGIRTVLGGEIHACPWPRVPPNVRGWLDAYRTCGGEMSLSEARSLSPVLVEALCAMKALSTEVQIKSLPKPEGGRGNGT